MLINDACTLVCRVTMRSILQLGSLGACPPPQKYLKIKSYKIEFGGNFYPAIMVIAKNAHIILSM